jgi:hypothetical protein
MKKQLIIFTIFCILLAGIVLAVPALENIYGVKNFVDGLQSNGATVATLDANSKVPLANSYTPDLSGYVPYDVNSHVADSAIYDKHTNLDANSLTLTNASIDPNGTASFKACKINNLDVATLDANSKVPVANNYNSDTKNWVMNGNMEVAQRGTTLIYTSWYTYLVDRFSNICNLDGATFPVLTYSQQKLTSGDIPNSYYYYRLNTNGAGSSFGANSYCQLLHYIEHGVRNLCGLNKKITIVCYARSDIPNKKLGISIRQSYGSGGNPSSQEVIHGHYVTLTSIWTKYTFTFTTNTLIGKSFGTNNDDALIVNFYYAWGTSRAIQVGDNTEETFVGAGNIDIAQVALYAGDVAYPFEPVPFDIELQRCMRYYEKSWDYVSIPGTSSTDGCEYKSVYNGWHLSDSMIRFKVPKRAANCNIVLYSTQDGSSACGAEYNIDGTYVANRSLVKIAYVNNFFVYSGDGSFTSGNQIRFQWVADADF